MKSTLYLAMILAAAASASAQPPQAEISNSQIRAKLYLPDTQSGYYRGTRFDWSGVIPSLEWNGHTYFGQWFERYDPKTHDAIAGPVEEFGPLGYEDAKPGEAFVMIGVGALKKREEARHGRFSTYDIADPGAWSIKKGRDWIEFTHKLGNTRGYAYEYKKKVRLDKNRLILEHHLKNTGSKAIATNVYDHNFYMLDGRPTSPDVVVRFAFDPTAKVSLNGLAEIRGREWFYTKELQRGETVQSLVEGFRPNVADYDIRVENRKTGAGVRQTSDRPMSRLNFWSIRTTACPEAYIDVQVEPGKQTSWRITYEFYVAQASRPVP